jgi:hypothetical protein
MEGHRVRQFGAAASMPGGWTLGCVNCALTCEQVEDLRAVRAGMWSQYTIFRHYVFVTVNNFAEFPNGKLVHIRRLAILTSRWHDPCLSESQKENEMNSIQLILSGLFLVAILLMARAGAQNTATTTTSGNGRAFSFSAIK